MLLVPARSRDRPPASAIRLIEMRGNPPIRLIIGFDKNILRLLSKPIKMFRAQQGLHPMKAVEFLADSLDRLREFPADARREAGFQLDNIQNGIEPADWKPMKTVGAGVREIRIREASGAFRVIYLATLPDAVYVLHCFQKKDPGHAKADIDLAAARLRDLLRSRK
ncbi:type II toxin-antitoxin system RelE/ParE family toxin [Azotobacter vinelandii]